jgi:hypothetical protein
VALTLSVPGPPPGTPAVGYLALDLNLVGTDIPGYGHTVQSVVSKATWPALLAAVADPANLTNTVEVDTQTSQAYGILRHRGIEVLRVLATNTQLIPGPLPDSWKQIPEIDRTVIAALDQAGTPYQLATDLSNRQVAVVVGEPAIAWAERYGVPVRWLLTRGQLDVRDPVLGVALPLALGLVVPPPGPDEPLLFSTVAASGAASRLWLERILRGSGARPRSVDAAVAVGLAETTAPRTVALYFGPFQTDVAAVYDQSVQSFALAGGLLDLDQTVGLLLTPPSASAGLA